MALLLLLTTALLGTIRPVTAACTSSECATACGAFDLAFSNCNYDHQGYSSYENCVCDSAGTVTDNENGLITCLACHDYGSFGSNPIDTYALWSTVCGAYELQGEQSAINMYDGPPSGRDNFYTSSVLPVVRTTCATDVSTAAAPTMTAQPYLDTLRVVPLVIGLGLL